ncbi:sulfonate transport system permease protein [Nocardioides zeae]|uniref:Sulfonate transport system permease protein n=1 Tax=Nocardioides zeae TaxID=1457234 RepID=A0ACC6IF05_9ACTN|nr:ABC transporter permease subunit [Nocardioides zeae]MDR6174893.1 sulfonate transport system permease protein [Nocardioides zeae]MDR6209297.1 sulfonate transport system permease protein [Nocardioides zeae]
MSRLAPWVSPLLIVVAWAGAYEVGLLDPRVLPSPVEVVRSGVALARDGVLLPALGTSLVRVVVGTAIGVALGLALGLASGYSRLGELVVDRPLQMLRAVPFNALLPLFVIAFGVGETMKVLLIAAGVLVPIYLNTAAGIRQVDPRLVEVARVYRFSRPVVAYRVLLLGALPSVLTGLRFALAIAWIALVTSELVNTTSGLGFVLTQAQRFVRPEQVVLCIVLYALLGVLTDALVRLLEGRLLVWQPVLARR